MSLRYISNVVTLEYDPDKCRGCGVCVDVCPHAIFVMDDKGEKAVLTDRDLCMECGACMLNCPFDAIRVRPGVGCAWAIMASTFRGKSAPSCE
ncbi:MAG: mercury methylation ferredoxin HgcB [Candidatus Aminicenantes bacterium]|nr:mercury methylation ferredoxin HgcB [Candidatus Aminicenantes bacterium]